MDVKKCVLRENPRVFGTLLDLLNIHRVVGHLETPQNTPAGKIPEVAHVFLASKVYHDLKC